MEPQQAVPPAQAGVPALAAAGAEPPAAAAPAEATQQQPRDQQAAASPGSDSDESVSDLSGAATSSGGPAGERDAQLEPRPSTALEAEVAAMLSGMPAAAAAQAREAAAREVAGLPVLPDVVRNKDAKRELPLVCHVVGCGLDLTTQPDYYQRYRVCKAHLQSPALVVDGIPQRFCQQCGRFQPVAEFDRDKRNCRARLQQHNSRRRKVLAQGGESKRGKAGQQPAPLADSRSTPAPVDLTALAASLGAWNAPLLPIPAPRAEGGDVGGLAGHKRELGGKLREGASAAPLEQGAQRVAAPVARAHSAPPRPALLAGGADAELFLRAAMQRGKGHPAPRASTPPPVQPTNGGAAAAAPSALAAAAAANPFMAHVLQLHQAAAAGPKAATWPPSSDASAPAAGTTPAPSGGAGSVPGPSPPTSALIETLVRRARVSAGSESVGPGGAPTPAARDRREAPPLAELHPELAAQLQQLSDQLRLVQAQLAAVLAPGASAQASQLPAPVPPRPPSPAPAAGGRYSAEDLAMAFQAGVQHRAAAAARASPAPEQQQQQQQRTADSGVSPAVQAAALQALLARAGAAGVSSVQQLLSAVGRSGGGSGGQPDGSAGASHGVWPAAATAPRASAAPAAAGEPSLQQLTVMLTGARPDTAAAVATAAQQQQQQQPHGQQQPGPHGVEVSVAGRAPATLQELAALLGSTSHVQ